MPPALRAVASGVAAADSSAAVLVDLVRRGVATTRSELARVSGFGRATVADRVDLALAVGLLEEPDRVPSNGGRSARRLQLRADAGRLVVAVLGTAHLTVAVTDLAGTVLAAEEGSLDSREGPEAAVSSVGDLADRLLRGLPGGPVWGVGLAFPGAVDFRTGRSVGMPVRPGWADFDARAWFGARYAAPVWVDNDLNLLALAQWRETDPAWKATEQDILLVKVSYGIGVGLITSGRLHRGRNGSAGDIAHTMTPAGDQRQCRCGMVGCLEASAGGWALARDATDAARDGRSAFLSGCLAEHPLGPIDIAQGVHQDDPVCIALVERSARLIGLQLAQYVGFFNPAAIYVGGIVPDVGPTFHVTMRRALFEHTSPFLTRDLRLLATSVNQRDALRGAAGLVIEELFEVNRLSLWLPEGSPRTCIPALYG